ncbi:unnamed protein product [Toxocara canis]|uniref:Uncharacterized protein n=1 Tax=Toxocara canis TaxID=6265 RepID=A0A3P7GVF8_TOXCA|nr:unnamed protein product [Toxocara canis]
MAEDGTRLLFRHAESVLSAEVDFHHYEDVRSKCSHVTASIVHPAKRQFLTPVILDEGAHDLRHVVVEHIVSPIRIALLGHENAFLRLLGNAAIVERILKELPVRSILCLERTCVHAYKACNGDYGERVWRVLLERDFGTDAAPIDNETSRNAYRRMFIERKRERQRRIAHDLEFERRHPLWVDPPGHPMPNHPHIPFQPDPDLPEGPMYPQPGYPFIPPENPFPAVPRFQPPRRPRNPLDPFSGSELLPSRPRRPGGLPRQLPDGHSSFADGGFGGSGFI